MIKKLILAGIAIVTIAISSCSEDTSALGNSLTSNMDQFVITSDTFAVSTRSIVADSVLSRSSYSYLGRIKDPETGSYISGDFMTQFGLLESDEPFTDDQEGILSRDESKQPIADSCFINVIVESYMGDSLAAMKMAITELAKPMKENVLYYTNFDPEEKGYLRKDGIHRKKVYSITDLTQSDSIRNLRRQGKYYESIVIPLNDPYTDKEGNTYNNYGTYIMRMYYSHPEYFKNSDIYEK